MFFEDLVYFLGESYLRYLIDLDLWIDLSDLLNLDYDV